MKKKKIKDEGKELFKSLKMQDKFLHKVLRPEVLYFKDVDILDIYFSGKGKKKTEYSVETHTDQGVTLVFDFNKKDNICGIEIFDFSKVMENSEAWIKKWVGKKKKK